ncbi:MAG: dephospho-CoA kinase [Bdellovibrionales bacterium]
MKWIGLTGGIATGKSTVSKILRDLGLPVIDADFLAREVIEVGSIGFGRVVKEFGSEVLNDKGEIDRVKLGEIVFNNSKKREALENIIHPLIHEMRSSERLKLEQQNFDLAFYDVPLLFEKKLEGEFDAIVLVYCSEKMQRSRMQDRNNLNEEQISSRLKSQLSIDDKLKKSQFVIINQGSLSDLKLNVLSIVDELRKK